MKETLHFDIRTKLFLLVMINILLFSGEGLLYESILMLGCAVLLLLSGLGAQVLKFSLLFLGMGAADILISGRNTDGFLLSLILFIVVILRRFLPLFMVGRWIFSTRVSEFIACMWKLKLPKNLIISVSVIFRFFPAVREEWQAILASMKMRGIGLSFWNFFRHPLLTTEYLFVPLLLNAVKISEELAEAALCRGLDCQNQHTSLTEVRMKIQDYLVCFLSLAGTLLAIAMKTENVI